MNFTKAEMVQAVHFYSIGEREPIFEELLKISVMYKKGAIA